MGEGDFGGGGSVHWDVRVDDADPDQRKWPDDRHNVPAPGDPTGPRRRAGVEKRHGKYFTVAIRLQGRPFTSRDDFVAWLLGAGQSDGQLSVAGNRATFLVPIENATSPSANVHQIQIRWDEQNSTI